MSKKLLALLLALVMIVGSFTSVLAADPAAEKPAEKTEEKKEEPAKTEEKKDEKSEEKKDEKSEEKTEEKKEEVKDEYLAKAIDVLKKAGFISGYSKDSEDFKAEKNVTRAEFASMIVRVKGLEDSAKSLAALPTGFKDVPTNLWANGYIAVAKQQGIVNGYPNGTFQPNRQISYQDMATMLTIALGKAEAGTVYPAGYIVKAQQLGLFNKVDVAAYTDMATRGNVFKMVYNMVTSKEFGQRKILKAIVLENPRVEKLAKNQITVEVIQVVQKADWVDANRDKRGDQHTYTLDDDAKFDCEQLLGKVVDITVDKNDKLVDITVDDSYQYHSGRITAVNEKKLVLDWSKKFSVAFDERYDSRDERVYRTYLNDADKTYEEFARDYNKRNLDNNYDFARVTVKNGKVIFIDAYKFDDVAPVAEVKGNNVWYYTDEQEGRIVKTYNNFPAGNGIIFVSNGVFSVGKVEDITKDDVVHFYKGYMKAVVNKSAKVETELVKTHLADYDDDGRYKEEYIVGKEKDEEYWLRYDRKFAPIYSYEGKEFKTVKGREDFEYILGRKVKVLLGLDGSVQLVQSDLAWNDGINAIRKITSYGEVSLLPSKGEAFWAKEGRDTQYYGLNVSSNRRLNASFDTDDLVYFAAAAAGEKEQTIAKMLKLAQAIHEKDNKGLNTISYRGMQKASVDSRYIRLGANKLTASKHRYFDNLHAYYIEKDSDGNEIGLAQVGNFGKFIDDNDGNADLEAYLLTEGGLYTALNNVRINPYNFLKKDSDIANTVIFKNAIVKAKTDLVYAEVMDKYGLTNTAVFRDADDNVYTVELDPRRSLILDRDFANGDIVKLYINKDSKDKDIKQGYVEKRIIRRNDATVTISREMLRNQFEIDHKIKYFDGKTQIFNRQLGDNVQVYYDEKDGDFVRVIRYFKKAIGGEEGPAKYCKLIEENKELSQFNVEFVNENGNKWYKVNANTRFEGVKFDNDGNRRLIWDYGFDYKGLNVNKEFADNAKKTFFDTYKNGYVKVTTAANNPDLAVLVQGYKTAEDVAKDYVAKAVTLVNEIPAQKYASTVADGADTTANSTGAEFKKLAEKVLKDKGLEDYVEITSVTNKSDAKGKYFETAIKSKQDASVTGTAKNDYVIQTAAQENQALLDAVKATVDGQSDTFAKTSTAKDRAKELLEAALKNKGLTYDATKLTVALTPVVGQADVYSVAATYDAGANQGQITYTVKLAEAK